MAGLYGCAAKPRKRGSEAADVVSSFGRTAYTHRARRVRSSSSREATHASPCAARRPPPDPCPRRRRPTRREAEVAAHNFKVELGKLEQLDKDTKADLGKRLEARQAELYKEMQAAVAKHAEAEGIDVVIAYGDAPVQTADDFANVKRRMHAIDIGAGILFYARPGLDITDAIVTRLNDAYRATEKKKTAP